MEQGLCELLTMFSNENGSTLSTVAARIINLWQAHTLSLPHANLALLLGLFTIPTQSILWFKLIGLNKKIQVKNTFFIFLFFLHILK